MQQKIQSVVRGPQPGPAVDVGEFPDVETGSLPVSHIADSTPQNDELLPSASHCGTGGNIDCKASASSGRKHSFAAGIMIFFIRIYQKAISPWLPCQCRFTPSCSHYAVDAFRKRGFWMGCLLTAWRLMRCQPFARSGYDPVPEKGFRNPPEINLKNADE